MLASVQGVLEKARELRRRGADCNVFQLLRMEGSEDDLHSRFIAELLNPRGSHGQGDSFLRFFLETVGKTDGVRPREARVKCEHDIGHLVTVLAEEVKTEMKKRTLGGKWEIRILTKQQKTPGLTVRNAIWRDSDLEVRWEWDYLGICSPTSSSGANWVSDEKFREKYPRSTPDGWRHWRYVRHRFDTEEGIDPLFDQSQRRSLAECLASELVYLANYCDEKFRNQTS